MGNSNAQVAGGGSIDTAMVDRLVAEKGKAREQLIPLLQGIQHHFHYLPVEALERLSRLTGIKAADIAAVAGFYDQFRTRPAGQHRVKVCVGTACHVKGSPSVYDAFREQLHISGDEDTDKDGLFTVEQVACLGCCQLAPAVMIDDITYGFVTPEKTGPVLRDFLRSQAEGEKAQPGAAQPQRVTGEARICLCSSCVAAGAQAVHSELQRQTRLLGLPLTVRSVACTGISFEAPLVELALEDGRHFRYGQMRPSIVAPILLHHFRPAGLLPRLRAAFAALLDRLYPVAEEDPVIRYARNVQEGEHALYFGRQQYIVTEHGGRLDPLDLEHYLSLGGFRALQSTLRDGDPQRILDRLDETGLRGRGGAGYPTGRKWAAVREAAGDRKYLICNGDEGDPGAFMDRMILESFPFRVIEGILIAAWTIGAQQGIIYVRAEYPLAVYRMQEALAICARSDYVGSNILGSDFSCSLSVLEGAGAFVCGEETALIAAVEGRRGMPGFRPPYPAQQGLHGRPTLVNNVETFALVPWLLRHGGERFASLGSGASRGTKTFALAGKIRRGGLIEVEMGMTLREIVEDIGGGVPDGKAFKAVQIGGPSGGCIPAALADTAVDYEALLAVGGMMGSGGLVVLDEDDCMVDVARYFMAFTRHESCGRCTFCRVGTARMLEILERLTTGRARSKDLDSLETLAHEVSRGSLCGLGRTASNPVLSTLTHFRSEYQAHLEGRCPAASCRALITYTINDACIGCTRCAQRCPADAIQPHPYQQHSIDQEKCVRCGSCLRVCPVDAVEVY